MRTSLNEIKQIEDYLFHNTDTPARLVMDAKMIISPELAASVLLQQQVNNIVQSYGRKELKAELEAIHTKLFSTVSKTGFRNRILGFFSRK